MDDRDRDAAVLATRQDGLLSLRQCREVGLTRSQVTSRVARGRWEQIRPGVSRIRGTRPTWAGQVLAAVLAAGPGAVASHATAARLLGLQRAPVPEAVEITVPRPRHPRLAGVAVHQSRELSPLDLVRVGAVLCTSGPRTLVDLGSRLGDDLLTALVDDAVFGGVAERGAVHRRAAELAAGRGGSGVLIRLTAPDAGETFRSWLEREAARALHEAGVPEPEWNVVVTDGQGVVGEVDACWRVARVVVEFDGLRFHSSDEQRRADRARDRRLTLAGYRVLRYTWLDVRRRPEMVATQIGEALRCGG